MTAKGIRQKEAHGYEGARYPIRFAAIYFLPSILIEMGPMSDGMKILQRFSARQTLADRLFRPPPALKSQFRAGISEMILEFDRKDFGHEVRLLTQPGHGVLEAALAAGFGGLSHFNVAFRSVMGVTPSRYARLAAGKAERTQ
jgi:AraC-like DNA-binding protein